MRIEFDLTGTDRKSLVKAISEITGADSRYLGMPTAAYQIDYFTVTRDGVLEFDDRADSKEIETLLNGLSQRGFIPKEMPDTATESDSEVLSEQTETNPHSESTGLTVAIPIDKVKVGNLMNLLESKGDLIKKALDIENLTIDIQEDKILFPWFDEVDTETIPTYTHFISALCKMSLNQKRISSKAKEVDNEKYAFRCFLLRLGFIGMEYKSERKILLRNLSGSSAFKNGGKSDEVSE